MAFNPFQVFRKRQKVVFAGLIFVCMLVFIGSFGAGDPFQRGLALFGAGRYAGTTVLKLQGHGKVNERDLQQTARQRKVASDFLFGAAREHRRVADELRKEYTGADKAGSPLAGLGTILRRSEARFTRYSGALMQFSFGIDPARLRSLVEQSPPANLMGKMPEEQLLAQYPGKLADDLDELQGMAGREGVAGNSQRLEALQKVATLLGFQDWLLDHPTALVQMYALTRFGLMETGNAPELPYFGGTRKTDGLLDFLMWKTQADKLGIVLTDEDVRRLVNAEAAKDYLKEKSFEKDPRVVEFLKRYPDQKPADLMNSLRDEFRVVMAQAALLGREPGVRAYRGRYPPFQAPAYATPGEFFQYFKKQRTTLGVRFLPVAAADFLSRVTQAPPEQELRNIYDRFRELEPDPGRRDPGFKEPRRAAVEYVYASPADKYYKDEARQQVRVAADVYADPEYAPVARVGALALRPLGAGLAGVAASLAVPLGYDPYGQEYYRMFRGGAEDPFGPTPPAPRTSLLAPDITQFVPDKPAKKGDTPSVGQRRWRGLNTMRPGHAAAGAALAGHLTTAGTGGGAFGPALAWYGMAAHVEAGERLLATTALVGGVAPALPSLAPALTALSLAAPFAPETLPFESVRGRVATSLREKVAEALLRENLAALRADLAKVKGTPEKAKEEVKKAIAKYHLQHRAMDKPMSRVDLIAALKRKDDKKDDLPLGPLHAAFRAEGPGRRVEDFVDELLAGAGLYDAQERDRGTEGDPQAQFLSWRTEDLPPRVRRFDEVRAQVVDAWRTERASQLALARAEAIERHINGGKLSLKAATEYLRKQGLGEVFELEGMAQLIPPKEALALARTEYRPYQVPEDKRDLFPYPPDDLVAQLLTLQRPGEATVVVDRPSRTFYVAVLAEREDDESLFRQFKKVFGRPSGSDGLWQRFMAGREAEHRKAVVEQLRREAGPVDDQGRWKVPAEVRERFDGDRPDRDD